MVKVVPPSAKETAGSDCWPSRCGSAARTLLGSSIALINSRGEARSSSRSSAATRMRDIGWLPLSSVTKPKAGNSGLGVFHLDRLRVFLVAVPVGARHAFGEVPGDRESRVAQKARLAAGSERLPGFPELGIAFDGEALQSAQRIGATFRGDGLLDQSVGTSLSQRRLLPAHRQQHGGNRKSVFHGISSLSYFGAGRSYRRLLTLTGCGSPRWQV